MSLPPLPAPADLTDDPEGFEAEYLRQLSLCMLNRPNRALEWMFAKCDRMLIAAEALIADIPDPSLGHKHKLPVEEIALKREQIHAARVQLEVLQDLRLRAPDPEIATALDLVVPLALSVGMACHEVAPRTQKLLGGNSYLEKRRAEQAKVAALTTEKKTEWKRDLMPEAINFVACYRGAQSLTAMARKFMEEFSDLEKSDKQIKSLLRAAIKKRETILDSPSMSNGC